MYSGRRHTAGFAAALLALLFTVTLRALVPVGYMPDVRQGIFHLVICGPAETAGADSAPDHDERPPASEPACVFAAANPVAGPDDPPPLPRPPVLVPFREPPVAPGHPPAADRSEGPPPPARAPPVPI